MIPEWMKYSPNMGGICMKTKTNQNGLGSVSDAQRNLSVSDAQRNFESSIDSTRQKLYGMVYGMVRNHDDTQDLLQDILTKAYKSIGSFRGESNFSTWIHTIAYNTTLNHIRKSRNVYKLSIDDIDSGLDTDSVFLDKTTAEGVDKECMRRELSKTIYDAISKLPVNHQDVVTLFDIEGWSHREISVKLGVNECTVRSRLFYAHKKLQELLVEYKEVR